MGVEVCPFCNGPCNATVDQLWQFMGQKVCRVYEKVSKTNTRQFHCKRELLKGSLDATAYKNFHKEIKNGNETTKKED